MEIIDWFLWLSQTNLEPSLVHEYGLAFAQNELQQEDIACFNHEFLQSMGISIAKHRLEILKLARKEKEMIRPNPMTKLLVAISKYVSSRMRKPESSSSARVLIPRFSGYWRRWRGELMLKGNKKLMMRSGKQESLRLTNGSSVFISGPRLNSVSSPLVIHDVYKEEKISSDDVNVSEHEDHIRWDTMFQNLKPT